MKKFFDKKKKNNKGFSLVELIVVVAIMAVLMAVLVPTLVRNVEKSRQQKDKTAIATLRDAIVTALSTEACLDATVSTSGATASGGVITIANLFGAATASSNSTDAGAASAAAANGAIIAEVEATIGAKTITLTSKYADATIILSGWDPHNGVVIMDVDSSKAADFYIDSVGQHTGLYGSSSANDNNGDANENGGNAE